MTETFVRSLVIFVGIVLNSASWYARTSPDADGKRAYTRTGIVLLVLGYLCLAVGVVLIVRAFL